MVGLLPRKLYGPFAGPRSLFFQALLRLADRIVDQIILPLW
jgi:hypothetical protein